jgi:hypothetical protein
MITLVITTTMMHPQ